MHLTCNEEKAGAIPVGGLSAILAMTQNTTETGDRENMDDLNTCPYCGASPVRIIPAMLFGRPRVECLTRLCPAWSPAWSREREAELAAPAEPTPTTQPDRPLDPAPHTGPRVFLHGVDLDPDEEPVTPGPIFLWATRHNDFGDV